MPPLKIDSTMKIIGIYKILGFSKYQQEKTMWENPYDTNSEKRIEVMTPYFFNGMVETILHYFPVGCIDDIIIVERPINYEEKDYFYDWEIPHTSGPKEDALFKKIGEDAKKRGFWRAIGVSHWMIRRKTEDPTEMEDVLATTDNYTCLVSLPSLSRRGIGLDELIIKSANSTSHEIGHTLGLEPHLDPRCIMHEDPTLRIKRDRTHSVFCEDKCLKRLYFVC